MLSLGYGSVTTTPNCRIWKEGYTDGQVLAALAHRIISCGQKFVWSLPPTVEVTWSVDDLYEGVHLHLKGLDHYARLLNEIRSILYIAALRSLRQVKVHICVHLDRPVQELEGAAGWLARPSLRSLLFEMNGCNSSLRAMDWARAHSTYEQLLELYRRQPQPDEYRRLEFRQGRVQLWHRHWLGDVLLLEVEPGNIYRLWDVFSCVSRSQHTYFWLSDASAALYASDGLLCYGKKGDITLYGPAFEGVLVDQRGTCLTSPFDPEPFIEALRKSILQYWLDECVEKVQIGFEAYFVQQRVHICWRVLTVDDRDLLKTGYEVDTPFCQVLRDWFTGVRRHLRYPVPEYCLVAVVRLNVQSRHEVLLALE